MKSTNNLQLVTTKHPHIFRVKLNLNFQTRFIGLLDISSEGKFLTDRKEKHVHRKTRSLGLNGELLNSPEISFKWVVISFEKQKLITTRMYWISHSKVFTFIGFEKQYFLPLSEFGIDKAEKYEKSINKQLGLFGEAA